MLAAAIRASLIEAGEPDTSQRQPPAHGLQRHKPHWQLPIGQHQDGASGQDVAACLAAQQPSSFYGKQQNHRQVPKEQQQLVNGQQQQSSTGDQLQLPLMQQQQHQQQQQQSSQLLPQQQRTLQASRSANSTSSPFSNVTAPLRDSASSQGMGQGPSERRRVSWLDESGDLDQSGAQIRPSKSSHALLQLNEDAEKLLSSTAESSQ